MTSRRLLAATLGAIVWLGIGRAAPAVAACRCRIASEAQSVALADVVFQGVALEGHVLPTPTSGPGGPARHAGERWSFMVESAVKGKPPSPVEVVAGGDEAPCGYGFDFEVGVRYLVLAHRDEKDGLWTSVCTGTRDLDDPPRPASVFPPPLSEESPTDRAGRNALLVVAATSALAGVLYAGYARRRRTRDAASPF